MKKIQIKRKIPATMATQHPDNASAPFWKEKGDPFISTIEEAEESFRSYRDYMCDEYMWDWEGKHVDEAVVDKLFTTYYNFFRKRQLGRDIFLTFRLPNIWLEKGYRIARAFMAILTSEDFSHTLKVASPPVFEVILPMTDKAEKLIYLQKTFSQLAKFKYKAFGEKKKVFDYLRVIPLIEGIEELISSRKILEDYAALHKKEYKTTPEYIRPFIARSDPALNAGMVSAIIAAKIALSEFYKFSEEKRIPVFPIIGVGALPFRGGLSPNTVKNFLNEYAGIKTVTIQSAFRYDYPYDEARKAIRFLNKMLKRGDPAVFSASEIKRGKKFISIFSKYYCQTIEEIANTINNLSEYIPKRRERMLHIGLFGYARGMGKKKLPRAITFTAVLYSLGIPPEFIGAGRGIRDIIKMGFDKDLMIFYKNFIPDMIMAGNYLNKENLHFLAKTDKAWSEIVEDIKLLEDFIGRELGPTDTRHFIHRNITSNIYFLWKEKKDPKEQIIEAARLRQSLG
ncbi:MAG: phosphoenolpyruvate carboxylase [Nitrospirae bacterium]|nr:phosphoenolpyruvate carboxylase [Nitrospirota bacterium]